MTDRKPHYRFAGMPLYGIAFLIVTAASSLAWSSYVPVAWDEYLSFWTDRLASFGQILEVQLSVPISVDPLVFHAAAHAAVRTLGATESAMRVPALLGFLTMQICLFVFVRRISNERAAVFALAVPALTTSLFYSFDGRPYGLLLGFSGLAMISWQSATRRDSHRTWSLIGLALWTALSINVHYFGILILLPICIAEFVREFRRPRPDIPVLVSIGTGAASFVLLLPFARAAEDFRAHYCCKNLQPRAILNAYLELVTFRFDNRGPTTLEAVLIALTSVVVLWSCIRQMRRRCVLMSECEFVFMVALAGLPIFGYALASFTTEVLEPRYVICSGIGVTALVTIGLAPLFQRGSSAKAVLIFVLVGICVIGIRHIIAWRRVAAEHRAVLNISPQIRSAIKASSTGKLYFQNGAQFALANYYEPDEEIRSRLVLVYSREMELKWLGTDTYALTALHMQQFTGFAIQTYESVASQSGNLIFASGQDLEADWANRAIQGAHARVKLLGSAFGINVESVRFRN